MTTHCAQCRLDPAPIEQAYTGIGELLVRDMEARGEPLLEIRRMAMIRGVRDELVARAGFDPERPLLETVGGRTLCQLCARREDPLGRRPTPAPVDLARVVDNLKGATG